MPSAFRTLLLVVMVIAVSCPYQRFTALDLITFHARSKKRKVEMPNVCFGMHSDMVWCGRLISKH